MEQGEEKSTKRKKGVEGHTITLDDIFESEAGGYKPPPQGRIHINKGGNLQAPTTTHIQGNKAFRVT